jgi:glycosyltransferase involved in cell wall biosynthesis
MRALRSLDPAPELLPISLHASLDADTLRVMKEQQGHKLLPWGRRRTALLWTMLGWPTLETWLDSDVDLIHHLELSYPIATHRPWLVTIHDLGPLTHPEYFSGGRPWLKEAALRRAVNRADALMCDSQSTAEEVRDYVGHSLLGRLAVVHAGVSSEFCTETGDSAWASLECLDASLGEGWPFVLAVGSINPRKNLSRVVQALELLSVKVPHHLLLAGASGWDSDETWRYIRSSTVSDRVHYLGYVSDAQLNALYRRATAFIYPSLYEGFGLPVLEAMACGCPVVTSSVSSLPEVAGDAALLVDPTDVTALADAVLAIVEEDDLAAELRALGKERSLEFTWDRCAEQVAAIYSRVI